MGAKWVSVLVGGCLVLAAGCSSDDASKAAVCAKAVGVIVVAEASDDAHRRVDEAQTASRELRSLATQTSDTSLADALRNAATTTGEASTHWSTARLTAWVRQETSRFNAIRTACG